MANGIQPTTIVIFGASGDLSRKKLIPALFDLFLAGYLPEKFSVIGFARSPFSDPEFREFVKKILVEKKYTCDKKCFDDFTDRFFYSAGNLDDATTFATLAEKISMLDTDAGACTNKIFYLAVSPVHYDKALRNLAHSGLATSCIATGKQSTVGWTRVLIEKPFGNNLAEAQNLDQLLGTLFVEDQIFRIDHYLAKETLQNILSFRFSNSVFEPLWNREHIEKIQIRLLEKDGVGTRGAFYDAVGALRDVGQNHLLQMLALVAMEYPGPMDAHAIRAARATLLKSVRFSGAAHAMRGQYKGYTVESGVASTSTTETYFNVQVEVENDRFRDVPIFLETGKGFADAKTEIIISFKGTPTCVCPPETHQHHANTLTFSIQPKEAISLLYWAKKPSFEFSLEPKTLSFSYDVDRADVRISDAYERVLYDCLRGDQTLFTSTEEILAEWHVVTDILAQWTDTPLDIYDIGRK